MSHISTGAAPPGRRIGAALLRVRPGRDPVASFWRWIALPAALVYAAGCVLVLLTLGLMTSEINRIDVDRTERSISAALDSIVIQLADQAMDEAVWTEAYLNTYGVLNAAWLDGAWGTTARTGGHYDTAIVTDATGRILFGESNEGQVNGVLGDHFSSASRMLASLEARVAGEGNLASVASFSRRATGPSAIAGAVIRGSSSQLAIPVAEWRILWLARRVDDAMLASIANRFHVPEPRLLASQQPRGFESALELRDEAGDSVGTIAWSPLRPGDAAFVHTASVAAFLLLILGALIAAVLSSFRRTVMRRAESDRRDWIGARYDRPTGLLNRMGLEEVVGHQFSRVVAELDMGFGCIEFDGLKDIAASHGEQTVDRLLTRIADLIDLALDGDATLARIGPDQFALARVGADAGIRIGRHAAIVVELLAEAVALGDLRLKVRTHVGLAAARATADTVDAILVNAATALHRARETGEPIVAYEPSLEDSRERLLAMQADIRRGLDADEFDLVYQPIFDFETLAVLGVEALLRWPYRAAGALSPGDFIPVAEASGLIEDLGLFALRRACENMAAIPDIKVSVNVSTVQLRSPTLVSRIASILSETAFPAERLQLELTESFLLAQPDRAKATIEELRGRGISLALDDFGTGFSSIGYLRQFSFDRVKLDRSLVDHIDGDPVNLAIVESTMTFAFAMGLPVTAEGVERREEAATLLRLGCREFQGYLLSRPLTCEELSSLLAQQPMREAG